MNGASQQLHNFLHQMRVVIVVLACAGLLPIAGCADEENASTGAPSYTSRSTMSHNPTVGAPVEPSEISPPGPETTADAGAPVEPSEIAPPGPEATADLPLPPSTSVPTPVPDNRRQAEQSELVTANAYWRRPDALTVDQPAAIGLGIQTAPLTTQINARMNELPGTNQPAGQIEVSRQATATLVASSADAEVTPAGSQNTSLDKDIQMAWQWTITPKRPTNDLKLTAYVTVHIQGGPDAVITTPINLHIPVHGSIAYTLGRIFTNWGTWSAIVVAAAGGATWIRKKTLRSSEPSTT
jgi:hypothetical protein